MARYGEAITRRVRAIDVTTGLPVTGDAANIDLYIAKDSGSPAATTNSAVEDGLGYYAVDLTAAENTCDTAQLSGESSTSNVVIIGAQWDNLDGAEDIADAILEEATAGHDTAGTVGELLLDVAAGTGINGEVADEGDNTRALLDRDNATTRATLTHAAAGDQITVTRS